MATLDGISDILMLQNETLVAHTKELKLIMKNIRRIIQKLDDPEGIKAAERSKNNALNRPYKIGNELADFLGFEHGCEHSRSNITKLVTKYIRDKGLKDPENGKVILVKNDAALQALLKVPDDVVLTYQNIQTYLSPHYVKETKPSEELVPEPEVPAPPTSTPEPEPETPKPVAPKKIAKKPTVVKKPTKVRKPVASK
tara:strand:+ start:5255 stop:5848 length:594 start_codon:yes stop_codon:yes gene_type:complete